MKRQKWHWTAEETELLMIWRLGICWSTIEGAPSEKVVGEVLQKIIGQEGNCMNFNVTAWLFLPILELNVKFEVNICTEHQKKDQGMKYWWATNQKKWREQWSKNFCQKQDDASKNQQPTIKSNWMWDMSKSTNVTMETNSQILWKHTTSAPTFRKLGHSRQNYQRWCPPWRVTRFPDKLCNLFALKYGTQTKNGPIWDLSSYLLELETPPISNHELKVCINTL